MLRSWWQTISNFSFGAECSVVSAQCTGVLSETFYSSWKTLKTIITTVCTLDYPKSNGNPKKWEIENDIGVSSCGAQSNQRCILKLIEEENHAKNIKYKGGWRDQKMATISSRQKTSSVWGVIKIHPKSLKSSWRPRFMHTVKKAKKDNDIRQFWS